MIESCNHDRLPNNAGSSSTGAEFCSDLFQGHPMLTISLSNTNCFGGVPLAQVEESTCFHPLHGGDGSSSSLATDDSLLSSLVGITGTLLVLVALLVIGLLAVAFWLAYRRWRVARNWLWTTEPDDPDDIPMEEMVPPLESAAGKRDSTIQRDADSPPVQLYLSRSGGVPVHIDEESAN